MRSARLFALFACRTLGLFRLASWLTRDRLRILCYHGFELDDESRFRPGLFMKARLFERRLETIRRYGFRVIPLDEAVERLYAGTLPDHALVITADDGFHSFHHHAVPRLRRFGFPATVYATTYHIQLRTPVFRLVVQYMFWKTTKRSIQVRDVPWSDDLVVDLTDPIQVERAKWDCIDHGEQHCSEPQRVAICGQLGQLLDVPYDRIVESKLFHFMSPAELKSLADADICVELHTHRHRFPSDDREAAEQEIHDNRAALRQWIAREARHFCYPSGLWHECQWHWLDMLGLESSTTCEAGLNDGHTPRHALRRFLDADDRHPLDFEAAVSGFTHLMRRLLRLPPRSLEPS